MIKQAPSLGRIAAMVVFALSCIGLLIYLWLTFGGAVPLRPEGYRFTVRIPEAATLVREGDVRLAGINVGKVKATRLDARGARTIVEIELDEEFAPIPRDTRVMLRQKTLLGETYVELTGGSRSSGLLADGGELPDVRVQPSVELDEIFDAFDAETRAAFKEWVSQLATAIRGGRSADLNDALGNLEGFAVGGAELLRILDEQEGAVAHLVRNTGEVFGAISERRGMLRSLIRNSHDVFSATASRDEDLARTFAIFPTFLDETRATAERLERFADRTRPLVAELRAPADDLGPTVRDLARLAPDLDGLFRELPPLIGASRRGLPDLGRVLGGAEPVFERIAPFLDQLNPILSYANYHQATIAGFITNSAANFSCTRRIEGGCDIDAGAKRANVNLTMIDPRSFTRYTRRPPHDRGNAYLAPNALSRALAKGVLESFDCGQTGGTRPDPVDFQPNPTDPPIQPPCFVAPPQLYDGRQFTIPRAGHAPVATPPRGADGG